MNQFEDLKDEDLLQLTKNASKQQDTFSENRAKEDDELIEQTLATMEGKAIEKFEGHEKNPAKFNELKKSLQPEVRETLPSAVVTGGANYWEITDLPSKYRLYPKGTSLQARPLKVIEIKKLSSLNENNADYVLNDIIKRTVKGIDVGDILIADKLYIIFWLRANTFRDSGYVVNFHCQKCEMKSSFHFKLNNLQVQYLSDEYEIDKELSLNNQDKIQLKFLTISDQNYLDRYKEMNAKAFGDIEADDEILGLANMLMVNNKEMTLIQKYNYICELSGEDYSTIMTYVEKFGMGIEPIMNVTCDSCGGIAPERANFRADFFVPNNNFK